MPDDDGWIELDPDDDSDELGSLYTFG